MAPHSQPSNYVQGHSEATTANHQLRTAEVDAAFLLPHIKKTDRILDVGCGPGTITAGLARYASEGATVGVDLSAEVLQKARALAAESGTVPTTDGAPGAVTFAQANVLDGLPYADGAFDVVYCSQVLGHMPPPDMPLRALAEMRRVLRPGGVLATREAVASHFFPRSLGLDRLWTGNLQRAIFKGAPVDPDKTSERLPALLSAVGFGRDGDGKEGSSSGSRIRVGVTARANADPERRRWLARRTAAQLTRGDPLHQSWLDAGVTEDEMEETIAAANKWAEDPDAWVVSVDGEMLAWK